MIFRNLLQVETNGSPFVLPVRSGRYLQGDAFVLKFFSDWLRDYEPVVHLVYRLAIVAVLAAGIVVFRDFQLDLGEVNDHLVELRSELTNIRGDLEDSEEDATPTGLEVHSPSLGTASRAAGPTSRGGNI
jgi:hypothetical protein